MSIKWPVDREASGYAEMGTDNDLPKQVRALMIAIHDLREDVALLMRATGVPPAGDREKYPEALGEMPDLPAAIRSLAEALELAGDGSEIQSHLDETRRRLGNATGE